mmetsp:Transcript_1766/g.5359  ORF Transcript_1766/g.5359 Transcript_1766/m.5359 type:complete len:345 (-) Transcript_1766:38-1072(-)
MARLRPFPPSHGAWLLAGACILIAATCSGVPLGSEGEVVQQYHKNLELLRTHKALFPLEEEDGDMLDVFEDRMDQAPTRNDGERRGEESSGKTSIWWVSVNTILMAIASGFGALPFFFVRSIDRRWLGIANALASGVMLAASFGLIYEGLDGSHAASNLPRLIVGLLLGLIFIVASQKAVDGHEISMGQLQGMDAKKAMMVMGIMTLHSFSEGLGVGVSYGGSNGSRQGMVTTWAIALHNIPEGLAVALVAIPRGESKWRAAAWAVFSSLPQPIVAIPAYMFVEWFSFVLPVGLGCAAGTMIWMVFAELIPDAMKTTDSHSIATVLTLSLTAQVALQSLIENSM